MTEELFLITTLVATWLTMLFIHSFIAPVFY